MALAVADGRALLHGLLECRKKNKYCDVTVLVDGKRFNCHRFVMAITSGYFDSLFSSSFEDGTAAEITLTDISSKLFQDILEYMYTGEITLTLKNAYELLKTSDYFVMKKLKDHCISFIEQNPTVENLLAIYVFAFSPAGDSKLKATAVKHAAFYFQILVENENECFLNLEFDLLDAILKKLSFNVRFCDVCRTIAKEVDYGWFCWTCEKTLYYCGTPEEILFSNLCDWITHDVVERLKYFPKLANYSKMNSLCIKQWETMISRYTSQIRPSIKADVLVKTSAVHVYALTKNHRLVNFQWDSNDNYWLRCENHEVPFDYLKGLTIGKKKYFLTNKSTKRDGIVIQFWAGKHSQWSELQSPPAFSKKNALASIDNSIYLYMSEETPLHNYEAVSYIDLKTDPGSSRIYTFILDLKRWFQMPPIPQFLYNSYFVADDEKLFVIGGTTTPNITDDTKQDIVQLFDVNTSKWSQKSMNVKLALGGSVCCFGNRIYICEDTETSDALKTRTKTSDALKTRTIHVYDSIADEWRIETTRMVVPILAKTLVAFNDCLWVIPQNPRKKIEAYDLKLKTWHEICDIPSSVTTDNGEDKVVSLLEAMRF